MSLVRHLRRPEAMPRGAFYHIECDCGWAGKVELRQGNLILDGQALTDAAEELWVSHVPPRERRVYLLLDTRAPDDFLSLPTIRHELQCASDRKGLALEAEAKRRFETQLPIRGNFLMPEGTPIFLHSTDERDGMYYGTFSLEQDGPTQELPVGEIRTPDGQVWRAE